MGWNVNLNIYHRVQSKLLHERGGKEGKKVAACTCRALPGDLRALSARFMSSICYNILAECCRPSGDVGGGGGPRSSRPAANEK